MRITNGDHIGFTYLSPKISGDGRYIAYSSSATNLVPGDTNGQVDAFLFDRVAGTTIKMSQALVPTLVSSISDDGRYVVLSSLWVEAGQNDIRLWDRVTGTTTPIVAPGNNGGYAVISGDGRYVLTSDETTFIWWDRTTGITTHFDFPGAQPDFVLTDDGSFAAVTIQHVLPGGGTGGHDVVGFVPGSATPTGVALTTDGHSDFPSISDDGRYVVFISTGINPVPGGGVTYPDVYVRDRTDATTVRLTAGHGASGDAQISGDGQHVTFDSYASDLLPGDLNGAADIFNWDRTGGVLTRISQGADWPDSNLPTITDDGRFIAYQSAASDLVPDDPAGLDVFLWDRFGGNPSTGFLRVTTSPAVAADILVDGIARDSWALTWAAFASGDHDVCFGRMPGYATPACQSITVTSGNTTTVQGTYAPNGYLRAVTSPAVPSTVTVDGVPRNDWGMWTEFPAGTHNVCFGAVAGFNAPSCRDVIVTAGASTTTTGTFTANAAAPGPTDTFGYVRATTSPAVNAPISVDGIVGDNWGLTWVKLPVGSHQVCFGPVPNMTEPASCTTVDVTAGATSTVNGTYAARGFLRVLTSPALPGTITVNGEIANAWGVWAPKAPGTYQVCFGAVAGHTTPACQNAVVVTANDTTTITGTYTP